MAHIPVLIKETIDILDPKPGQNFIDCTFGRGGHSRALLERVLPDGLVVGLDWDNESLQSYRRANGDLKGLILENLNFADVAQSQSAKTLGHIDGMLFDLGMSSWHIDESGKGFAFSKDEPLDMRYDSKNPKTAAMIVNTAPVKDLEKIIAEYGEERAAKKIVRSIESFRKAKRIETAGQLAAIVVKIAPPGQKNSLLARVFQALRIEVNHELENIERGLADGFKMLSPGGRMAVITFHSLEDRLVKIKFRELEESGAARLLLKKPAAPADEEVTQNPRARSAKLRAIEKIS